MAREKKAPKHNPELYRRHLTQSLGHLELAYQRRPSTEEGWTMDEEAFLIQAEQRLGDLMRESLKRSPARTFQG